MQPLPLDDRISIVDIGSATFESTVESYRPLLDDFECSVVGFEPNKEEFDKLDKKFAADPRRRYLPIAIADGKIHELRICLLPGRSSLFEPNLDAAAQFHNFAKWLQVVDRRNISTCRLDDVEDLGGCDFVKLDIQGSELMALQHGRQTLASALVVECEVEFFEQYRGQPLFAEIEQEMRSNGFQFHRFLGYGSRCLKPFVSSGDTTQPGSQWLWSDALFVKDISKWPRLDTVELKKLAIILSLCYQSADFAHRALTMVDARENTDYAREYRRTISAEPFRR